MSTQSQPSPVITCDFTPPEVRLERFWDRNRQQPLPEALAARIGESLLILAEPPEASLRDYEEQAVADIANTVRGCLEYQANVMPWDEKPTGDCYAFTWLVSDVAEQMGFESRIAFCNDHAFNFLVSRSSGMVHMTSADVPFLTYFDIASNPATRNAFSPQLPEAIANMREGDIVRDVLNTYPLRGALEAYNFKRGARLVMPWLDGRQPAMTIVSAEQGKKALFTQHCLQDALSRGDFNAVVTSLEAIQECNLQIDGRPVNNSVLLLLRRSFKRWARDNSIASQSMVDLTESYKKAMSLPGFDHNKRFLQEVGDWLRFIGSTRRDATLLKAAAEHYDAAKASRGEDPTLRGKIRRTHELLTDMDNA